MTTQNPSTKRLKPRIIDCDFAALDPHCGEVRGRISVLDKRVGANQHEVVDGEFVDGAGTLHTVTSGTIEDVWIESPKRGAPRTKAMRDVAVYLAWMAYLAGSARDGAARALARTHVLGLWEERGWRGFVTESHIARAVERGQQILQKTGELALAIIRDDGPPLRCCAFAARPEYLTRTPSGKLLVTGPGYVWVGDLESAVRVSPRQPFFFPSE